MLALIRCHQGLIINPKDYRIDTTWFNSLKIRYLCINHQAEDLKVIAFLVSEVRSQHFEMSHSNKYNDQHQHKNSISQIKKDFVLTSNRIFSSCWGLQLH